ncbi:MAG: PQQ-binding-like beta-propeller repeat protein [Planctomycetota bacterium]
MIKYVTRMLLAFVPMMMGMMTLMADDWNQWRGPNRDGISEEKGLLKEWPADGPPLEWKTDGLGSGYSSVSIANGQIITLGDLDDGSFVIAMSESNGTLLWKTRIGDNGGHRKYIGPRSTPTIDGDFVFALNQHSDLACLNRESGELIWNRNLEKEFGGRMMSGWRYSESPLVDGDQVICTPGGKSGTLLALNRSTGEEIWQTKDWTDAAAYSSVIVATIHGRRQYIQLTGKSVAGVDPTSGEIIWKADREGKTAVIPTPVVQDNIVFVTSGYGVGCNAFQISEDWTTEELYANTNIANHHGGVILLDGHIFGSTNATFRCVDIDSGDADYKERSIGKGAIVYADGHLYLRSEGGPIALIEATPSDLVEVSRFEQPDRSGERAWPHPVIANGKLYLRDQDVLLCYNVREPS